MPTSVRQLASELSAPAVDRPAFPWYSSAFSLPFAAFQSLFTVFSLPFLVQSPYTCGCETCANSTADCAAGAGLARSVRCHSATANISPFCHSAGVRSQNARHAPVFLSARHRDLHRHIASSRGPAALRRSAKSTSPPVGRQRVGGQNSTALRRPGGASPDPFKTGRQPSCCAAVSRPTAPFLTAVPLPFAAFDWPSHSPFIQPWVTRCTPRIALRLDPLHCAGACWFALCCLAPTASACCVPPHVSKCQPRLAPGGPPPSHARSSHCMATQHGHFTPIALQVLSQRSPVAQWRSCRVISILSQCYSTSSQDSRPQDGRAQVGLRGACKCLSPSPFASGKTCHFPYTWSGKTFEGPSIGSTDVTGGRCAATALRTRAARRRWGGRCTATLSSSARVRMVPTLAGQWSLMGKWGECSPIRIARLPHVHRCWATSTMKNLPHGLPHALFWTSIALKRVAIRLWHRAH